MRILEFFAESFRADHSKLTGRGVPKLFPRSRLGALFTVATMKRQSTELTLGRDSG
jgi:hypothetical protein